MWPYTPPPTNLVTFAEVNFIFCAISATQDKVKICRVSTDLHTITCTWALGHVAFALNFVTMTYRVVALFSVSLKPIKIKRINMIMWPDDKSTLKNLFFHPKIWCKYLQSFAFSKTTSIILSIKCLICKSNYPTITIISQIAWFLFFKHFQVPWHSLNWCCYGPSQLIKENVKSIFPTCCTDCSMANLLAWASFSSCSLTSFGNARLASETLGCKPPVPGPSKSSPDSSSIGWSDCSSLTTTPISEINAGKHK